jgi:capsular polysaccharide biosynthesis protein
MSQQPLDLRRSLQIVRRHWVLVGIIAVLGLLAGAGYAVLRPPMLTGQALVVLSPTVKDTRTQVMIAESDPVLADALRRLDPGMSPQALRTRIQVTSPAYNLIAISAQGKTAAQAERAANAVARSYVGYLGSGMLPGRVEKAQVLQPVTEARAAGSVPARLLMTAGLGALAGALIGVIAALAVSRSDRRLRERDEIAESIGVPVLASVSVDHPSDTASWKKLLEAYDPGAVDAWRLRNAIQHLGLDLALADGDLCSPSLSVLSLSHDRKALALGPQLAVFAASLGIPTALVLGPQQDTAAAGTLRAAGRTLPVPSERLRNLRVITSDQDDTGRLPDAGLAVVVAVVDGKAPRFTGMTRTTATVLGVSAGSVTADQLARIAAGAAANGHHIAGILVADPDPADHTTGRLPVLARPVQRAMPARIVNGATEPRR